jgi:AraC family transcriptional regulator, regulatory protein of adaptative response / methylated-DNA-[protein]-cysteine methyltransferase
MPPPHAPMLDLGPGDDRLFEALCARDPAYEGRAYACVTSTGIFCRLTCPARKPLRRNVEFRDSVAACLEAGFRPCLRCHPLEQGPEPLLADLVRALEADPDRRWTEGCLVALGHDPSTVRRLFRRRLGMSFLDLARLRRMGRAAARLEQGGPVIEAQLDGGFTSGSGFRDAVIQQIGAAPMQAKGRATLRARWIDTPIGQMLAIADAHALHLLEFTERRAILTEIRAIQKRTGALILWEDGPVLDCLAAELGAYFEGKAFGFAVRIARQGTPFQEQVWIALRDIPPGETRSYADLARAIGRPTATRAVAAANGANPVAILTPCHRVIGSDGSLTGYGGGLWRKRWLLSHEAPAGKTPPMPG